MIHKYWVSFWVLPWNWLLLEYAGRTGSPPQSGWTTYIDKVWHLLFGIKCFLHFKNSVNKTSQIPAPPGESLMIVVDLPRAPGTHGWRTNDGQVYNAIEGASQSNFDPSKKITARTPPSQQDLATPQHYHQWILLSDSNWFQTCKESMLVGWVNYTWHRCVCKSQEPGRLRSNRDRNRLILSFICSQAVHRSSHLKNSNISIDDTQKWLKSIC